MKTGMHVRTVKTGVASLLAALLFWTSALPPLGLGQTVAAQEEEAKSETTPPPYSGLPACQVGMKLGTGEGCHVSGSRTSVVAGSAAACAALFDPTPLLICHAAQIDSSAVVSASKDDDGSWIIDELAGAPAACSELRGLHEAARLGNAEWVACLAAAGADVNARDERGETPLHIAVEKGSEELAQILLAAGADVNVLSYRGRSVPIDAEALTRIFTTAGSDETVPDAEIVAKAERSVAPLQVAVENSDLELVRMLVVAGMALAAPETAPETAATPAPETQKETAQQEEAGPEAAADATPPPYSGLPACQAGMKLATGEGCHVSGSETSVVVGSQSACVALFDPAFLVICHAMQIDSSAVLSASKDDDGSWIIDELAGAPASCGELKGLHEAVRLGKAEWVACLARTGAEVNALNERGETPLHIAVEKGSVELARTLIAAGADVDILSYRESSAPIVLTELMQVFTSAGPDPAVRDAEIIAKASISPLQVAVENGDLELVQMLVAAGMAAPEPAAKSVTETAPEPTETATPEPRQVNPALSQGGFLDSTLLHDAIDKRDTELVRLLVEAGADVNQPGFMGSTPLHDAIENGDVEIVQILVAAGADINRAGFMGQTPLSLAIDKGNEDIVKILLAAASGVMPEPTVSVPEQDASVSKPDAIGTRPLHIAVLREDTELVQTLIAAGADLSAKDNDGNTSLHLAVVRENADLVQILVEAGADLSARDADDKTPLDHATERGYVEIVTILVSAVETGPESTKTPAAGGG